MLLNILKNIETKVGKNRLRSAMDLTSEDIKSNRIRFNKKTTELDFLRILLINLNFVEAIANN